ncbi:MAG: peptidoglycan DD-metalloendopeptidase family protein [Halieaceae bacterium]|jgi:murein DD-endopeptidase MepM/ murein hydrolase activator NlpD|nr:peptidoglycan DD-metalloendopeptidase family protein [Halieaceae bacterium]
MNGSDSRAGSAPSQEVSAADFPRRHLLVAAASGCLLLVLLALVPGSESKARREQIPIELPVAVEELSETVTEESAAPTWNEVRVESGDNLSVLFARAGFSDKDVYQIVKFAPGGKSLTRLYPGEYIGFLSDDAGALIGLKRVTSPLKTEFFLRDGGSAPYRHEVEERVPDVHRSFASAQIESSLFLAGQRAGMPQALIMELANIFGGVIDFVLDPRRGDTFHVVYEELYLDGEKFGNGSILAAEFVNRGQRHTAYRYVDETNRPGYFNEEGLSMRRQFMLAPVDFTRISSNFNPRRLHPIYKTRRPHRGTDYAAPRGTPVFAAGDGRVLEAGYTSANGNYVVLQHGEAYTTKYLHLHKRTVRKGDRVAQNQVIGTVGSTGAATGPHLHYEFLVNGVHRNPRTVHKSLPKAKSLAAEEMPRFLAQTQSFQMQLASIRQQQIALNRSGNDSDG